VINVKASLSYSFRIIQFDEDTEVFSECSYKSLSCLLR